MKPALVICIACTVAIPVFIIGMVVSSLGRLQTHEVYNWCDFILPSAISYPHAVVFIDLISAVITHTN